MKYLRAAMYVYFMWVFGIRYGVPLTDAHNYVESSSIFVNEFITRQATKFDARAYEVQ